MNRCATGAWIAVLALAAGCVVGPAYRRPVVDSPAAFRGQGPAASAARADLAWWDTFNDETLKGLVRTALTNNYDLRIAIARVEQARAVVMQARADFFPLIGYEGDATRGKNAVLGKAAVNQGLIGNDFLGTLNAAWELDLWGRIRRLNEAAGAEFLASDEARRGVTLSLVCAVAQAYFELLELDRLLEIARDSTNSFSGSLTIFSQRQTGGVASALETARAEAALASTASSIPTLELAIARKENGIGVLLGCNPGPIPRGGSLLRQTLPPEIPAGLPSALLERRPDILAAEQVLRAANAQVGVAVADFFPRIGLTALGGGISADLADLATGRSRTWSLAANATGPVFQGGRAYGAYRQAVAAREEAALRYRQTALNAFREVSDALFARAKLAAVRRQQERSVEAYRLAVKVSTDRYRAGRAGYYEVLEAQQQLFPAENALAQTRFDQLLAVVQLYKALGGGWPAADAAAGGSGGFVRIAGPPLTPRMPVIFVGHGNPMNALDDNAFSREWIRLGKALPRPRAILCVSAHWETDGTRVTAMPKPRTIHDFWGFPPELYKKKYPAPGSPEWAETTRTTIRATRVEPDTEWGLDHGTWAPLCRMFPNADVPVFQLSLDRTQPAQRHYDLGRELAPLRDRGVLIVASGNMVHNLGRMEWTDKPFDWAAEFDARLKDLIVTRDHQALVRYEALGPHARLAIPTNEHYLPMLYALALQGQDEAPGFFTEDVTLGSISMRGFKIG